MAAPRSGSTLLFEQLAKSHDFWTIGGESHGTIEGIPDFSVAPGRCDSNRLTKDDATSENVQLLRDAFYYQLRNSHGERFDQQLRTFKPRFLEKTPKNSLRIGLLNEIFPDALYIYLYRNPLENISSIIDAWQSNGFQLYRNLAGRSKPWSLLLPPGWQNYHNASVAETATFQWNAANLAVIDELTKMSVQRWTTVTYRQLTKDPQGTLKRLCRFISVTDKGLLPESDNLALSCYTLTPPRENKWHKNARLLKPVISQVEPTLEIIKQIIPDLSAQDLDINIDDSLFRNSPIDHTNTSHFANRKISRNTPCPCRSGLRYKHCHGKPA